MATIPQVINQIWTFTSNLINGGTASEVVIPIHFKNIIGQQGIDDLATRFSKLLGGPVMTLEDPTIGVLRILPSRAPEGRTSGMIDASKSRRSLPKQEKVARPPNAFILYRQHHHPLIKASDPGLHNNQISIILGNQWKNESDITKLSYKEMADDLKRKHIREHPGYSYQPRKSTEKKRRMTRRKAEALTAMSTDVTSNSSGASTQATAPTNKSIAATTSFGVHPQASLPAPTFAFNTQEATEAMTPLPELERTEGGNVLLNLGDEGISDEAFAAMLQEYNDSLPVPGNTQAHLSQTLAPPVIHWELTEEAQNDKNFYDNAANPEKLWLDNRNASTDMDALLFGCNTFEEMWDRLEGQDTPAAYDAANSFSDAELARMSSLWD